MRNAGSWFAVTVRDARGKQVPLCWLDGAAPLIPGEGGLPIAFARRARAAIFRLDSLLLWAAVLAVSLSAVCAVLGLALATRLLKLSVWSMGAAVLIGTPVLVAFATRLLVLPFTRRAYAGRLVEMCATEWLCASCGYDLHAAIAEPDGCFVCPECFAAWRLTRAPA